MSWNSSAPGAPPGPLRVLRRASCRGGRVSCPTPAPPHLSVPPVQRLSAKRSPIPTSLENRPCILPPAFQGTPHTQGWLGSGLPPQPRPVRRGVLPSGAPGGSPGVSPSLYSFLPPQARPPNPLPSKCPAPYSHSEPVSGVLGLGQKPCGCHPQTRVTCQWGCLQSPPFSCSSQVSFGTFREGPVRRKPEADVSQAGSRSPFRQCPVTPLRPPPASP